MRFLFRIFRGALLLVLVVAALAVLYEATVFIRVWWWASHNPSSTAFMDASIKRLTAVDPNAKLKHVWVPYEKVSDHLKRALIVAEDAKFSEHEGFDWEAIQTALEKNERRGKVVAGGSTITQQLAKNLFLSGERSFIRKGQEAIITVMIEQVMDKQRILEIYLNVIEWGDGIFGAEAAARHYFNKGASQLSSYESARLAAMVPRPRFYQRNLGSAFLAKKTRWIQGQMAIVELP